MKTAIQIAIENIDHCLDHYDAKNMLISLLENEKEEIIMAVTYGNSIKPYDGTEAELGLQYYEENYIENK